MQRTFKCLGQYRACVLPSSPTPSASPSFDLVLLHCRPCLPPFFNTLSIPTPVAKDVIYVMRTIGDTSVTYHPFMVRNRS